MRGAALRTIQRRVDRLAADRQVGRKFVLLHWTHPYEQCPSCGFDLDAHCSTAALAEAQAAGRMGAAAPAFIWYSTADVDACPGCGGALPPPGSSGGVSFRRAQLVRCDHAR